MKTLKRWATIEIILLLVMLSVVSCTGNLKARNENMESDNGTQMKNDDAADVLGRKAMQLAGSSSPSDLSILAQYLSDETFLSRLDSDDDYESPPHTLRVTGVLLKLAHNPAPEAYDVLVGLTTSTVFQQRLSRTEMLILACAKIKPPRQEVLQFWNKNAQGESSSKPLVVQALFENDTPASMSMFEQMMQSPSNSNEEKTFWLKTYAVPRRDNLPFLQAAERMLGGSMDETLKIELVRVIFDYSANWYPPRNMPKPPNPEAIQPDAKIVLRSVGESALSMKKLSDSLRAAVERRLDFYAEGGKATEE